MSEIGEPHVSYIADFISGEEVKATPEEIEAVQVFTKQLFEDYGYPKSLIQTHPQYRVKVRPSDTRKEYPVDTQFSKTRERKMQMFILLLSANKKTEKMEGVSWKTI